MEELWQKSAAEIAELVKSRQVSAVEVTQAALDRLKAVNGKLNAVVIETPEDALRSAELVDQAIDRGEDPGELAGVPVTVKVNIDQAGYANTNGLKLQENLIADQDSPVVTNFRKAGAIIVGRTNTPAFSLRWFLSEPITWPYNQSSQLQDYSRWFLWRCRFSNSLRNWRNRARHRHRGFSPISSLCLWTPGASPNSGTFPCLESLRERPAYRGSVNGGFRATYQDNR